MPPRTVICQLCGGKFFAASLAHHQKVCQKKVGKQMHECPYCHAGVPLLEMDSHVLRCPAAKAAGAKPTGASAALARRLDSHARGEPAPGEGVAKASGGNGMNGVSEYAEGDDVRIECQVCGRKFTMDRVGKHQAICEKNSSRKPRRAFKTQREYVEGGAGGAVVGVAKHMSKPNPPPVKSNWRKESSDWREAIKSARENPLPQWGRGADETHRQSRSPQARSGMRGGMSPGPRAAATSRGLSPAPRGGTTSPSAANRRAPLSPGPRGRTTAPRSAQTPPRTAAAQGPPPRTSAAQGPPPRTVAAEGFAAIVVKEQFRALDANGDGRLDPQELSTLLRSGDAGMTDHELGVLFDSIDRDHDGRIDFAEFVDFVFSEQGTAPLKAGAARGRAPPRQGPGRTGGVVAARGAATCKPPEWARSRP